MIGLNLRRIKYINIIIFTVSLAPPSFALTKLITDEEPNLLISDVSLPDWFPFFGLPSFTGTHYIKTI